eukprot:612622-Rhodomonas_salina.1
MVCSSRAEASCHSTRELRHRGPPLPGPRTAEADSDLAERQPAERTSGPDSIPASRALRRQQQRPRVAAGAGMGRAHQTARAQ